MKITEQDVYKKISVRAPYFALKDIERIGDIFTATIPVEQPLNNEVGCIGSGEVARHLAILGATALGFSFNDSDDFFYDLAYKAEYNRFGEIKKGQLKAIATCQLDNKREGTSFMKLLTDNGEEVSNLTVSYYLMPRKIFERQFKDNKRDLRKIYRDTEDKNDSYCRNNNLERQNIYKKMLSFSSLIVNKTKAVANLGVLTPELCMGHFPLYPAFPLAFASGIKTYLCGLVLKKIIGDDVKFFVKQTIVRAEKLAFAGLSLRIESNLISSFDNEYIFDTFTINNENNELIMNLKLTLKII